MSSFYDRFDWITLAQNLSASEKALCFALLKHLNSQDTCWPSKRLLAEETGLSARHIRRLVKSLVEKGILECTPRTPDRATSNLYTFHFPSETESKANRSQTDLPTAPPAERDCGSGRNDTKRHARMSSKGGQKDTWNMDRMTTGGGQNDTWEVDTMSIRGGQDVMGEMTRCHPELKGLELKELELGKKQSENELGNQEHSAFRPHGKIPRKPSSQTLPGKQGAAASPPQIIPESVSNPGHPERLSTLPRKVMELYSRRCPDLPPAGKLSSHLTRAVLRLVGIFPSCQSLDWWENYLDRAKESPILTESATRGRKIDLDWFLIPANVQKVLGGADGKSPSHPRLGNCMLPPSLSAGTKHRMKIGPLCPGR